MEFSIQMFVLMLYTFILVYNDHSIVYFYQVTDEMRDKASGLRGQAQEAMSEGMILLFLLYFKM